MFETTLLEFRTVCIIQLPDDIENLSFGARTFSENFASLPNFYFGQSIHVVWIYNTMKAILLSWSAILKKDRAYSLLNIFGVLAGVAVRNKVIYKYTDPALHAWPHINAGPLR